MAAKPEEEWREALIKAKPGLIEYLEVDDWFLAKLCADEIIDQNTSKTIKVRTLFRLLMIKLLYVNKVSLKFVDLQI